jgi:hypothetical protein
MTTQNYFTNNYFIKKIVLFTLLNFCFVFTVFSQNKSGIDNIFFGTELTEMGRNSFSNIGKENYAFMGGANFKINEKSLWGFRGVSINVDVSEKNLNKTSPIYKGDFKGVAAKKSVNRVYFDYYYRWNLNNIRIEPIGSIGIGHNNFTFTNAELFEKYTLNTNVLSIGGRLRFTFFEIPFIELGSVDAFAYTWKSNETSYDMGEAQINLWKKGGIFNWVFVGINVPLNKN